MKVIIQLLALFILISGNLLAKERIRVLILDGQNNHDWQSTTDSLQASLKATNRFALEVETAPQKKSIKGIRAPKADAPMYLKDFYQNFRSIQKTADEKNKQANDYAWKNWNPFKRKHQAIVLNYNGREWTQETKESAVEFVREGRRPCPRTCS